MSADVSPDSKCPICLDVFHNMSYLDRCLHKFCFRCILEWSKNKPECPLCKQPFSSIYHSIKSDEDFQKYELKQQVENSSFGYFEGVRFRYRTTLTGVHRQMRRTSPPPDNGMINFRRELYRRGVRVRNVRDGGRSRDTSAEFYRRNPACLHRLVPWLKRELMVLYGAHGSLVHIVQHIIMSRITRYDMEDGAIQEELRPFLQGRTEHFLHEFINFAKSPFNLEAYDQHAVYDCPAPSSNEHSSSNSSVIAISEDEENSAEMEPPGNSASTLSQSLWDDETPGPSYSTTTEPSRQDFQTVLDLDSESSSEDEQQMFGASPPQISSYSQTDVAHADGTNEDCASSDGDDCVIVGYVKPTTERTPELVHLSSDSDGSSVEENQEAPLQSQHIRFTSCSPANSHSSDSSKAGETPKGQTDHHHQSSSKERLGSNTYNTSTGRRTHKRFDSRERSIEGHKSKERDHKRKKSHSKSRGRKYSSKSPVISQSTFSSHARRGNFSKTDGLHARRDSDHSYQSYTHYRRERNGSVTHYTQRRSYYYSSHKYSHSKSRSRSRDSSHRRDGRRSRSRAFSSSCSSSPERKSHHDKPGGKRKYKAKHLAEPSKNTQSGQSDSMSLTKHKKTSKEKHHKRSKERSRRRSRSGSTEVVGERHKHHHKKKKHKKKSKKSKSSEHKAKSSPNVITIESDNESFANRSITPVSRTTEHTFIDNAADGGENPATVDQASQSH
uniref:E3 ubiquitin-protein ligase Topors n=1 Tax=Poecilia mexicana TaxID=48701 RepID=A0A3B3XKV3_9TELE